MSSPFSGSLFAKRKAELVEIAQALNIADLEDYKLIELREKISDHLDANEAKLSSDPSFKGLYNRRHRHSAESEADTPDVGDLLGSVAVRGRKSINKAIDKVQATFDAANIPLPESPLAIGRLQDVANSANESLSLALAPAQQVSRDLTTRLRPYSSAVVKYTGEHNRRIASGVQVLQHYLSKPEHIVTSFIAIELLFLLCHVVQCYDHTVFFPPAGGESGTIAALLRGRFLWLPSTTLTFRLPEIRGLGSDAPLWPAAAWWFFSTVLPPLALSTVITFVPHKDTHRSTRSHHTASRHQTSAPDPLSFAIFRLAVLLAPLTSAAPSNMVDSLEMSGNLQGRALGGGLLAALILADRLRA